MFFLHNRFKVKLLKNESVDSHVVCFLYKAFCNEDVTVRKANYNHTFLNTLHDNYINIFMLYYMYFIWNLNVVVNKCKHRYQNVRHQSKHIMHQLKNKDFSSIVDAFTAIKARFKQYSSYIWKVHQTQQQSQEELPTDNEQPMLIDDTNVNTIQDDQKSIDGVETNDWYSTLNDGDFTDTVNTRGKLVFSTVSDDNDEMLMYVRKSTKAYVCYNVNDVVCIPISYVKFLADLEEIGIKGIKIKNVVYFTRNADDSVVIPLLKSIDPDNDQKDFLEKTYLIRKLFMKKQYYGVHIKSVLEFMHSNYTFESQPSEGVDTVSLYRHFTTYNNKKFRFSTNLHVDKKMFVNILTFLGYNIDDNQVLYIKKMASPLTLNLDIVSVMSNNVPLYTYTTKKHCSLMNVLSSSNQIPLIEVPPWGQTSEIVNVLLPNVFYTLG